MHDGLARLLAKRRLEVAAVVLREVVPRDGLATVLVHPLENLQTTTLVSQWPSYSAARISIERTL